MNIVFLSNFYNHHQRYLSRELFRLTHGQYCFIETEALPEERKNLGYSEEKDPFVYHINDSQCPCQTIQEWIDSADLVIIGSAPEILIKNRKKDKKLIFRYSEHPLKKRGALWKYPLRWINWHKRGIDTASTYMLCASAYTAKEYGEYGLFKNKTLKWGYFPECKIYPDINQLFEQKNATEILWCGRLLDWKHPDDVVEVARRLKAEHYSFHINLIGTGEMEAYLKDAIEKYDLSDVLTLLAPMSPIEVRQYMENVGIYLFTSDHQEGWGAVLNEAMNSGCAVVASATAGSTPFLVNHNSNGLIYADNNLDQLYRYTKRLLDSPEEQRRLGMSAYQSITQTWNASVAASNLLIVAQQLVDSSKIITYCNDGPCSVATP